MAFYHRTTEKKWQAIKKAGVLWGKHNSKSRYTYLAPENCPIPESYGFILLKVSYVPVGPPYDNYGFNPPKGEVCWQFSVFTPIKISKIERIIHTKRSIK